MRKKFTISIFIYLLSFSSPLWSEQNKNHYKDNNSAHHGKDHHYDEDENIPRAKLHLNLLKKKHYAPMPVELDASKSMAGKGKTIVLYEFDFGDGSEKIQQNIPVIQHTFEILENVKEKKFKVLIKVQDNKGKWSRTEKRNFVLKQIPDPGENGKKTVAGIDLDENGIRDDIDRLINFQFKNLTVLQRQALRQYAMRLQTELVNSKSKSAIVNLWKTDRSSDCVVARIGLDESLPIKRAIRVAYINTDDRARADGEVEMQLAGESIEYNTRPSEYVKHCKDQF